MLKNFANIYAILSPEARRRFTLLCLLSLGLGLAETIGVLSVLPFVTTAADPNLLTTSPRAAQIAGWFGFETHRALLICLGAVSFAALVFAIAFRALTLILQTRFSRDLAAEFGTLLMGRYLSQDYAWFLGRHSSDLHKAVLSEVEHVVDGSVVSAIQLLAHGAVALSLLGLLMVADPFATMVVTLVVGGAYGLIFFVFRRRLLLLGKERIAANQARFEVVQEAIGGIKAVKLHNLEPWFLERYTERAQRMARIRTSIKLHSDLPSFGLEALIFGGMILFVLWILVSRDETLGEALPLMSLFAVAGMRLFPVLQQLFSAFAAIRANGPSLEAVHRDIATMPGPDSLRGGAPLNLTEALRIKDLVHSFDGTGTATLRGVSLTIPSGSIVGLAGQTGSGKSTLVDVILGLMPLQEGEIWVDETQVGPETMRRWQQVVGYVPQAIHLMDDTLAANVAFGVTAEDRDPARIADCLEAAVLDQFVAELPEGIETRVGERGVRLSGGQRQRLGIARALYRQPEFLVFDEATSALDTATETEMLDRVTARTSTMAVLMVAHRLTSLERCDTILVLDQGQIVASGTYGELTSGNAQFRDLHALETVP